ncbi:MAG TPA: head GIN domain-containing protein [Paucimonas sp.]|nr:head GIN domain-containing protein [Paucimonas sp.]
MRALMKAGAFLLGLAVVLVALSYNVLRAQGLEQSGETGSRAMATETRPVDAGISIIKLSGPIDLKLKQGATPSMNVRAEQRFLSKIVTTQNGNTLQIDIKGVIINRHRPMVIELTLPALQELRVHGSGDATVSGFSGGNLQLALSGSGDMKFYGQYQRITASLSGSGDLEVDGGNSDDVELTLAGSGDVTARGTAKRMTAKLNGSGDVHARELHADSVNLSLSGSGDAEIFAKSTVSVAIRGSGEVAIAGNPAQRNVSKSGSGDVRWE